MTIRLPVWMVVSAAFSLTGGVAAATFTLAREIYTRDPCATRVATAAPRPGDATVPKAAPPPDVVPVSEKNGAPAELEIEVVAPRDRARVAQFDRVAYRVTGRIPRRYRPVLFVRDPLGQYWSWGSSPNGRYDRVQFGVAEDAGRDFEVVLLVTDQEAPLGRPTFRLPDGLATASTVVTRQ